MDSQQCRSKHRKRSCAVVGFDTFGRQNDLVVNLICPAAMLREVKDRMEFGIRSMVRMTIWIRIRTGL